MRKAAQPEFSGNRSAGHLRCGNRFGSRPEREWAEHGIAPYVQVIAGQEMGSKKEHLALAIEGRYDRDKVIMIGDAPGDRKAAEANGVGFYPVNPGYEEASWARFAAGIADSFFAGKYTEAAQEAFIEEFEALLPETPPWKK